MAMKNIMPSRRMLVKAVIALLLVMLFENVCFGGQWTMMFYMAAHNDLYSQALTDIKELQKISGKSGIDILVQLDSPSGAYRYKVLPQGTSILASLGQSNSGSPEALADFGSWAVKAYSAQKYLLVLWDHGDGWSKRGKSIGIDGLDYLSVAGGELRQAVSEISYVAGQPLDIVVFDACNMQMAEVLMELDGICNYAVGSEALFSTEGMPYSTAWEGINGNTSAESLAISLVRSCDIYEEMGYQVTCSAVNINSLSAATHNLKSVTDRLNQLPISAFISPTAIPDSVLSFLSWFSYDLPLALDFIGNRVPDPEKTLVLDASRQFKNSVLVQSIAGDDYQTANGLAVWYPKEKNNFEKGIESYRNLKWSVLSGWDKLLYRQIYQQDLTAPIPQNVNLVQEYGGFGKLTWEGGYDPAGIERYQIRHSQQMIVDFNDRAGVSDSANWDKTGFRLINAGNGDTAYYSNSLDGQMTGKNAIQFDSSGNIGFYAKGIWGSIVLESSGDTTVGWDTLGIWNRFGDSSEYYYSAKVKSEAAFVRFIWNPFAGGNWVYIDNIKVCHPDIKAEIKIINTCLPFYNLNCQPGAAGFYQIRSVDSIQNQSPWSVACFYFHVNGSIKTWPNPFKDKVFVYCSSLTDWPQEVKIYNILGQFIDRMSMQDKTSNEGSTEKLYYWEPKAAVTNGIYIARVNSDIGVRAVKMILMR